MKEKAITTLITEAHDTAIKHGWWEEDRPIGELIALMHSELSEALEEARGGADIATIYYHGDKPLGVPIELADTVIRIFDFCGQYGIDLYEALETKMAYNQGRPYKHGGKLF